MPTPKPLVDPADRRVAGLAYAPAVASLSATAALFGDPRLFGPLPWWAAALVGAVCGGLLSLVPLTRQAPAAAVVVAAMWAADGGWVGWGWANGWQHGRYWLIGGAGVAVTSCAAYVFATPTDLGLPMYPAAAVPVGPDGAPVVEDEWGDLFTTVSKGAVVGVRTIRTDHWDTGTGYTARLMCPRDGTDWEALKKYESKLAGLLDLPKGGAVTVLPDDDAGARGVRVDVLETDAMALSVPYPTGTYDGPGIDPADDYDTDHDGEEWQ